MGRHGRRRQRRRLIRGFVALYGWRAYALPVLTALTIMVVLRPSPSAPALDASANAAVDGAQGAALPSTGTGGEAAGDVQVQAHADEPVPTGSSGTPGGALRGDAHHQSLPASAQTTLPGESESTRETPGRASALSTPSTTESVGSPPGTVGMASPCSDNGAGKLILVSISQQRAWMCQGTRLRRTTGVTTGDVAAGDATPTGSWVIENKQTDRYLTGPGYRDFVHFWMPYHGDFGLHDAPWQTFPFGSPLYRTQGSHGCVHVPSATMAWLYDWSKIGSTLVTIRS